MGRTMEDTTLAFRAFTEEAVSELRLDGRAVHPAMVAEGVRSKLVRMRDAMLASHFVASHEFVGSSLLIVADGRRTGVFWIDFAKTRRVGDGLAHRDSWPVVHDGIIHGLDNLILAWTRVADALRCQSEGLPRLLRGGRCVRLSRSKDWCPVREYGTLYGRADTRRALPVSRPQSYASPSPVTYPWGRLNSSARAPTREKFLSAPVTPGHWQGGRPAG